MMNFSIIKHDNIEGSRVLCGKTVEKGLKGVGIERHTTLKIGFARTWGNDAKEIKITESLLEGANGFDPFERQSPSLDRLQAKATFILCPNFYGQRRRVVGDQLAQLMLEARAERGNGRFVFFRWLLRGTLRLAPTFTCTSLKTAA